MNAQELKYRQFSQELINTAARESGRYNPATKALVAVIVRHGLRVYNYVPEHPNSLLSRPATYSCKSCGDERDVEFPCSTLEDIAKELEVALP